MKQIFHFNLSEKIEEEMIQKSETPQKDDEGLDQPDNELLSGSNTFLQ